jgi:hypothetical protein
LHRIVVGGHPADCERGNDRDHRGDEHGNEPWPPTAGVDRRIQSRKPRVQGGDGRIESREPRIEIRRLGLRIDGREPRIEIFGRTESREPRVEIRRLGVRRRGFGGFADGFDRF